MSSAGEPPKTAHFPAYGIESETPHVQPQLTAAYPNLRLKAIEKCPQHGYPRCVVTEVGEALVADPGGPGLRAKLINIGARVVRHFGYATFQMAEVAVSSELFVAVLTRIQRFNVPPPLLQCG